MPRLSMCAALSFGKAIAGLMAHSKGRSIGVYEAHEKDEGEKQAQAEREEALGVQRVEVFGMKVAHLLTAVHSVETLGSCNRCVSLHAVWSSASQCG